MTALAMTAVTGAAAAGVMILPGTRMQDRRAMPRAPCFWRDAGRTIRLATITAGVVETEAAAGTTTRPGMPEV